MTSIPITTRFNQLMCANMTELMYSNAQTQTLIKEIDQRPQGIFYCADYQTMLEKSIVHAEKEGNEALVTNLHCNLKSLIKAHAFFLGYTDSPFFEYIPGNSSAGYEPFAFRVKPNCLPSEALEHLTTTAFSLIDCSLAIQIVFYKSLLSLLGPEKFDALFSRKNKLTLSFDAFQEIISRFYSPAVEPWEKGDVVTIANVAHYTSKHPYGASQNYNMLCNSTSTFISLELGNKSLTHAQICDLLLADFNKPSQDIDNQNIDTQLVEKMKQHSTNQHAMRTSAALKNVILTPQQFIKLSGGQIDGVRINSKALYRLTKAPVAETKKYF